MAKTATAINSINGKIVELERCNAENHMLKNRVESLEKTLSNHGKVLNDVHIMLTKLQTNTPKIVKPPSAAQIKAATEAAKKLQQTNLEVKDTPPPLNNQPQQHTDHPVQPDKPATQLPLATQPDQQPTQPDTQLPLATQPDQQLKSDLVVPVDLMAPKSQSVPQPQSVPLPLPLPSPSAEVVMEEPVIDDHDKTIDKTPSKPKLSVATVNDTIEISDVSSSSDEEPPPPKPVKKNIKPPLIKGKPRR